MQNHLSEGHMNDKAVQDEASALRWLPLLLAALLAVMAHFSSGGAISAIFVMLAFVVGYLPPTKLLFFIDGVEANRRTGRDVLQRMSDNDIHGLLNIIRAGRKLEAIKALRAINNDGLKDAKNAIDLLDDFGLDWRDLPEQS